nr:immunoglobulin heavy chain junction region [Macaca mulatta]MOV47795.1 immunoglobulin heavy chain junction region [Macaca mulatta]MOV47870.1 immunoglobulin heavy chain junction region [Macaca mulatta]MOV47921.1 immunoglobulin heavy chain junction region [Macaca mulatta]MOV48335.1 immunoglobulin heavy chain junction region [Macaca mulatta]
CARRFWGYGLDSW